MVRVCMFYDFKQGKSAAESHVSLRKVFGDDVPVLRQCQRWFQRFRDGDETLEDEKHQRRPQVIDNEALREAIESDPCQTTRELAETFGCTHGTIENHLHAIGKVNRSGKWIPHELTNHNKTIRITYAGFNLRKVKNSGFLDSILTSDEKWISYNNATRKRQWLNVGEHPKPTPKSDNYGKKVMLCVWWNTRGLVYFEVLDAGQTVNSELYSEQLKHVNQALHLKGANTSKTKFLHDNARPHIAKITQQKIKEFGWTVLPHPPYSPDLAPSDFHLFRSMQHSLANKHFKNNDEVKLWVSEFFKSQPEDFYRKGIHSLRQRWQRVIDNNGEYLLD